MLSHCGKWNQQGEPKDAYTHCQHLPEIVLLNSSSHPIYMALLSGVNLVHKFSVLDMSVKTTMSPPTIAEGVSSLVVCMLQRGNL